MSNPNIQIAGIVAGRQPTKKTTEITDSSGRASTVIENTDQPEPLSYMSSLAVVDQDLSGVYAGRAFRSEKFTCLDIGENKRFVGISPSGPTQVHLVIRVFSTSETTYKVYLEPTVTDNGDLVRQAGRNPHIQFIGGYQPTYTIYENSTITDDGQLIRENRWGNGAKTGGDRKFDITILSPEQTLMFEIESRANGNCIQFEAFWEEWQQEDPV